MIYALTLLGTAATAGMVYAALWGLLAEHIRVSLEPRDDSRHEIERGEN